MPPDWRIPRQRALRAALASEGLDGLLVTHLPNIRYLSGFTGSAALLLVRPNDAVLVTDFRYATQGPREVGEAARLGADIEWTQSNHEGVLVDAVQGLRGRVDGALVNAAALSHSSLSLRDAFLAVRVPFVELHLSNIFAREPERRHSVLADLALGLVTGFGAQTYVLALHALVGRLRAA